MPGAGDGQGNRTWVALEASREKVASLWDWRAIQPLVLLRAGRVTVGEASSHLGSRAKNCPVTSWGYFKD